MPTKKKRFNARFPPARIKKIMQKDEEVGKVAQAVPVIISKALESFSEQLLTLSSEVTRSRNARTLTPNHIKTAILNKPEFQFLRELAQTIPDVNNSMDEDINTNSSSMTTNQVPIGTSTSNSSINNNNESSIYYQQNIVAMDNGAGSSSSSSIQQTSLNLGLNPSTSSFSSVTSLQTSTTIIQPITSCNNNNNSNNHMTNVAQSAIVHQPPQRTRGRPRKRPLIASVSSITQQTSNPDSSMPSTSTTNTISFQNQSSKFEEETKLKKRFKKYRTEQQPERPQRGRRKNAPRVNYKELDYDDDEDGNQGLEKSDDPDDNNNNNDSDTEDDEMMEQNDNNGEENENLKTGAAFDLTTKKSNSNESDQLKMETLGLAANVNDCIAPEDDYDNC